MRITWKDGVTTVAAVGTVVLERAYYHAYTWPLVSSVRWVVVGLAVLGAVGFTAGYLFDTVRNTAWSTVAITLALVTLGLTAFGLVFATSGYVVTLMVTALTFWVVSTGLHLFESVNTTDSMRAHRI